MGDFLKEQYNKNINEPKIISIQEFLKPSYEEIENEKKAKREEKTAELFKLLESDGSDVAKSMIDFLSKAFVDIADGAQCLEWEKETENLEIYLNFLYIL